MSIGSRKHKAVVILNHLLRGGRNFKVVFEGEKEPRTLVLDENYELCQLVKNDKGEDVLLTVFGVDMGPFVKLCEKLTDEEVFAVGCNTAFIDMADEENERREAYRAKREAQQAQETAGD